MAKTLKAFRLSDEAISILKALCEKETRSETNMIEKLIIEAGKREKIKVKTS